MISIQAVTSSTFVAVLSLCWPFFPFFISLDLSLKFAARLEEFHPPPVSAFGRPSDGGPQTWREGPECKQ